MRPRAAIFDFDGTLFDSMAVWETLGEDYLHARGIRPKPDLAERLKVLSLLEAAVLFQQEYGLELPAQTIMEELDGMIERAYREEVLPKPGMEALVRRLKESGADCAIATATDRYLIEAALERCGMRALFSGIFTCGEAGAGKDSPLVYRKAVENLKADRQSTLIFEDALHAAQTAKQDGFCTIGVYDAFEEHQKELQSLCDGYLKDLQDTEQIMKMIAEL